MIESFLSTTFAYDAFQRGTGDLQRQLLHGALPDAACKSRVHCRRRYREPSFAAAEVSPCGQEKEGGLVSYSPTLTPPLGSDPSRSWAWPPKKINEIYGYRTTRSMKSQAVWDFAQKYSAKLMTAFGIVLLAVSAGARWLQGQLELNHESMIAYDVGVIAFLPILQVIPVIVMTELKLRKQFG